MPKVKVRRANCPACAGPVEFRSAASQVAVCDFCRSVVARTDHGVENHGKLAELVETATSLEIGARGVHNGHGFRICGRIQYRHPAGGVWDEWYAAFPKGQWCWLADAQGKLSLMTPRDWHSDDDIPSIDSLQIGQTVALGLYGRFVVQEVSEALVIAAQGELPVDLAENAPHQFADLSGPNGSVATLEYGGPRPLLFIGKLVTWDELNLPPKPAAAAGAPGTDGERRVGTLQLNCPNCGGPLELHAPDQAERICCPHCKGLSDVSQGKLSFLKTLESTSIRLDIPLGAQGTIRGKKVTVIGAMRRSTRCDGKDYFWTEYLLFHETDGFHWLVNSEDHWSFVSTVAPGEVRGLDRPGSPTLNFKGRSFRLFQRGSAVVRNVVGEFYWKVAVGETCTTKDFIAPPDMLSIETSSSAPSIECKTMSLEPDQPSDWRERALASSELNVSLGTYLPHAELEQAFQLKKPLTRGWGVAPNQPVSVSGELYWYWAGFGSLLFGIWIIAQSIAPPADVGYPLLCLFLVSLPPLGALIYQGSAEQSRWSESNVISHGDE